MQGRKVTSEQHDRLLEGLRYGMTRRAAAAYAGFHHATLYRMIEADATLATAIEKAEGEAEAAYTKAVADAVPKNWAAAAWWLERRKHMDYARRDRVDVTMDIRKEVEKLAGDLGLDSDAVMAEVEEILRT
jgi:hypothetical protein